MFTSQGLLQQNVWAHDSYRRLIDHCAKLSEQELAAELAGFGFSSIREQLFHMAGAELFWINAACQRPRQHRELSDYPNIAQLRSLFQLASDTTADYLNQLNDTALLAPVSIEWEPGEGIDIQPALMLTHVLSHGFHHKGQVVAMCRLLGYPPPDTDLA